MPRINVEGGEIFDEATERFIEVSPFIYDYEHSLYSVSLWEIATHRPFLDDNSKSADDWVFYIKCMSIDPDINMDQCQYVYLNHFREILNHIDDPQTATTFLDDHTNPFAPVITNEEMYYWMLKFHIPFECDRWNFNHLMTLIRVCGEKENPKPMSQEAIYRQNMELNRARRAALKAGRL